jgi:hypothetical protein
VQRGAADRTILIVDDDEGVTQTFARATIPDLRMPLDDLVGLARHLLKVTH